MSGRQWGPVDPDALEPEVAAALVHLLATGWAAGAMHRHPPATRDRAHEVFEALRRRAFGAPVSAAGNGTRHAGLPPASSRGMEVSARTAADALGITARRVRQLATSLGIGRKAAGAWWFTEHEVERMRQRRTEEAA